MSILIADSGSTKCEWRLVSKGKKQSWFTQGMSPYFLSAGQMEVVIREELLPKLKRVSPDEIFFYGTGHKDPANCKRTSAVLKKVFPSAAVQVTHDLMGTARALCQHNPGVACILGTGCNAAFYNGKKIVWNSPGLGYVLGDEGSGTWLGRKVIQHFLYGIFDTELRDRFQERYQEDASTILDKVYHQPLPNKYLASFTTFLSDNRGHYMIENMLEDGINDFFYHHIGRYKESRKYPVHFSGSVAYHFRDVLEMLCDAYGMQLGTVVQAPMDALVRYHSTVKKSPR